MLAYSALIGDSPQAGISDREFKNEGIIGTFARSGRTCRWRKDLHSRPLTAPRARYLMSAETDLSADPS